MPNVLFKFAAISICSFSLIACGGGGGSNPDTTPPSITINGDSTLDLDYGSDYIELGAVATDNEDGNVEVTTTGEVTTNNLGSYTITYTASDSSGNTASITRIVNIVDNIPPTITLNGNQSLGLEFGSAYSELGATASDNADTNLSITTTGVVNSNSVGSYQITYSATDSSGNESSATRVVNIVDLIAPTISLLGNAIIELEFGSPYIELGATASDNADTDLSITTSGLVDINNIGSYQITYSVTDNSGNADSVIRTVNVVDNTPPTITLNGEATLILYLNGTYTEAGAIASDNVDGSISPTITGSVDTNVSGLYQITYSATDSNGNSASTTRDIEVAAPNYSFTLNDIDPTLWEGTYTHRFYFTFDQTEPVRKLLTISAAPTSTASSNVDFELITTTIDEPENSTGSYIEISIIDDRISEGDEFIDLVVEDANSNIVTTLQILLDDQTAPVITHNPISGSHFSPSGDVVGDNLFITSSNRIERYNLLNETTTLNSAFSPGIQSVYNDAITYENQIYIFAESTLYLLDEMTARYLEVSDAPLFLQWTSEIQVIDNILYIAGGRQVDSNVTDIVMTYDFINDIWSYAQPLTNNRYGGASAVVDNILYAFGGNYSSGTVESYNPSLNLWSPLTSNSSLFGSFNTAVTIGQYIFITISEPYSESQSTVLRYDTLSDNWDTFPINTQPRRYRDSFTYKGRIYLVGGTDSSTYTGNSLISFYIGD